MAQIPSWMSRFLIFRISGGAVLFIDKPEWWGLIVPCQIIRRDGSSIAVPDGMIVRRHDLDAGFIATILDVLMQRRVNSCLLVGFLV